MKKTIAIIAVLALTAALVAGCAGNKETETKNSEPAEPAKNSGVINMTMAEAKELFASGEKYLIIDVRTPAEFADGHIPGAINLPNEDIGTQQPDMLPDKDAEIYLYCRSGNRSGQAANKLIAMGYSNVINFGGIMDWTGDIEK